MIIVILGGELFTSNVMYHTFGFVMQKISLLVLLESWVVSWIGNWAGCVLGALCMWAMGVFQEEPWHSFLLSYTTIKVNNGFGVNLIRGVGCNFLVCVGTVFAVLSESLSGKMMGVWLPVFTFVVSGYEHSIANMFFMTVATFYGAPFSYGKFVWQNLIPVTIGNIVGGGLFLAVVSWYCWYREEFEHRSKKVLQHAAVTPIDTSFSFKM
eukprot:TRINITY_DN2551_c0_g2_i6.p1 TRINITY_DN2551_c0_g2~~TRINITY_DN2551_c0_g2_i6.p1  ORF type:complete len:210 (-),score=39.60 TRINITY_DN2551_c0_g2_i6:180-809(-)